MSSNKKKGENNSNNGHKITKDPVAIVGIGGSAGGLEAFTELIKSLPADTGMAFVFILHLEPTHESRLSEIFTKYTSMPVQQVKEKTRIRRNNIYAIPPDKYLSIVKSELHLSERQKSEGVYLPIDYFFNSLAKEEKNKAIGIVLSGTASDGTEGLRAIKAEGGLTFAQDEKSAKYPGMPVNAINSGNVDIVLPPSQIGMELVRISSHPYIAFKPHVEKESESSEAEDVYSKIFRRLRMATGVDFSNYKLNTIKRRITRRMVLNKTDNLTEYAKIIKESNSEVFELYKDLLINVTSFFRDPEAFEMLKTKVFPEIAKEMSYEKPLRIWIPGCSTGEEVYSVVISLLEYLGSRKETTSIQVFATDISDSAIEKARAGYYLEAEIVDLPDGIQRKYFTKYNSGYQINKNVRDVCIFARQDISKDPPFSKLDFISCRNLLIYFSPELQKKIIPVFHYALKPNGFLLLGTSESVGGFGDLFHLSDRKYKLYNKKESGSRQGINFSYNYSFRSVKDFPEFSSDKMDIQKEADRYVLSKFSPPGILVNSSMDIIQFRGKIGRYLDPSMGDASLNVFKMLKEILNLDLRTALRKAKLNNAPVKIDDIRLETNGSSRNINLEVIPIRGNPRSEDYSYLILFKEENDEKKVTSKKNNKNDEENNGNSETESDRLRKELIVTKEHLQSIIEERDATNEELRSALEELQSSNEELQSTNEEMETAREELQSTNEELETVNDELANRNEQLNAINNDLQNLISSLHIPLIMLDRDLKIRRYTPKAEKIWNLIAGDVGRPIGNINPNIEIPELRKHILEVLDTLESRELQIKDHDGSWYSVKIRPYRTADNKIDGVVISLYDVDTLKKDFDTAVEGRNFAREVFSNVDGAIVILDEDLRLIDATKTFYEMFGIESDISTGKFFFDVFKGELRQSDLEKLLKKIIPENKEVNDFSFEIEKKDKTRKTLQLESRVFHVPGKEKDYVLLMMKEKK